MKLKFILTITTFLFGLTAIAQQRNLVKIDSLINLIESNNKGIGSISVFDNGKEIYNRSFGQKQLASVTYTDQTKYQIGSITKTITASLIFKLIEEKKLKLSDKLATFFPDIPNANIITIQNLLEHTSGLGSYVTKKEKSLETWLTEKASEKEIMDEIINQGVSFQPNEKVEYSNSAYYLLTKIVEKLFNKNYSSIVNNNITQPLHLKNFAPFTTSSHDIFASYQYTDNHWKKIKDFDFSNVVGVGDIASTTKDLNLFLYNLFQYKILSKESVEKMKPDLNKKETYGRGLVKIPFQEETFYGHTGLTYGTNSILVYNEKDRLGLAISMNGVNFKLKELLNGVLSILYNKEYKLPNFNAVPLKTEK